MHSVMLVQLSLTDCVWVRVAYSGLTAIHTARSKKAQGSLGTAVSLGAQSLLKANSTRNET